jgi:hypothetical protein
MCPCRCLGIHWCLVAWRSPAIDVTVNGLARETIVETLNIQPFLFVDDLPVVNPCTAPFSHSRYNTCLPPRSECTSPLSAPDNEVIWSWTGKERCTVVHVCTARHPNSMLRPARPGGNMLRVQWICSCRAFRECINGNIGFWGI